MLACNIFIYIQIYILQIKLISVVLSFWRDGEIPLIAFLKKEIQLLSLTCMLSVILFPLIFPTFSLFFRSMTPRRKH